MLRVGMAALVMLMGSATAMAADRPSDPSAGGAMLSARQQSVASITKARWVGAHALPAPRLRVGDTLASTGAAARARVTHPDRRRRNPSAPARALAQAPAPDLASHLAWRESDDDAALAYAVSDTWSLGLGYRLATDETLEIKVAETGAVDPGYTSHSVFLRAHWQF